SNALSTLNRFDGRASVLSQNSFWRLRGGRHFLRETRQGGARCERKLAFPSTQDENAGFTKKRGWAHENKTATLLLCSAFSHVAAHGIARPGRHVDAYG